MMWKQNQIQITFKLSLGKYRIKFRDYGNIAENVLDWTIAINETLPLVC